MTPNPQDSAVALEVERAIREALAAEPTPCEWSAMAKPSAPYSDCGWRAVAMCGAKWMVGAPSRVMLADGGWNNEANASLVAACNPEAMRSLLAEIDRLRASQSDGTSGGWISVDERLPADGESVVVLYWPYNNRSNHQCMTGAVFNAYSGLFLTDTDGDELHPPSHWMPAPPLPNQGENHVG